MAGVTVDFVGTLATGLGLGIVMAAISHFGGVPLPELQRIAGTSVPVMLVYYAVGATWTFTGATVTAWLARPRSVFNAAVFGFIQTLVGIALSGKMETWYAVLGLTTMFPLSVLAGYLVQRTHASPPKLEETV